jgi:ATP-dependent 26S proteasome regulatory subunit
LAGTNRPDVLDVALKRPGRFDRTIELGKQTNMKKLTNKYEQIINQNNNHRQTGHQIKGRNIYDSP